MEYNHDGDVLPNVKLFVLLFSKTSHYGYKLEYNTANHGIISIIYPKVFVNS